MALTLAENNWLRSWTNDLYLWYNEVTDVDPSSPAATTGLNRGDVIQEVNHKPVHNVDEYNQAISSSGKKPVLLLVNHGGRTNFIVVEPTQ